MKRIKTLLVNISFTSSVLKSLDFNGRILVYLFNILKFNC